jgi:hypothetical protein
MSASWWFNNRAKKPPTPPAVKQALANPPRNLINSLAAAQNQQAAQGKPETAHAPSNQRFRSFAERYVIERCRDWPADKVGENAWEAILQARTIYNKVKEVGRTLGPDM